MNKEKFFRFIKECSNIMNIPGEELIQDESWFFCFDDRLTPKEACNRYKQEVLKEKENE